MLRRDLTTLIILKLLLILMRCTYSKKNLQNIGTKTIFSWLTDIPHKKRTSKIVLKANCNCKPGVWCHEKCYSRQIKGQSIGNKSIRSYFLGAIHDMYRYLFKVSCNVKILLKQKGMLTWHIILWADLSSYIQTRGGML